MASKALLLMAALAVAASAQTEVQSKVGGAVALGAAGVYATAPLGGGSYVAATFDVDTYAISAQVRDATGNAVGGSFSVAQTSEEVTELAAAATAGGNVLVAWVVVGADGSGSGIVARILTSAGVPVTDEFVATTYTAGEQSGVSVAAVSGGFAVTWATVKDGASISPFGKIISATGSVVADEFPLFTTGYGEMENQKVASLHNGGFAAVWPSASGVYLRTFSSTGVADSDEVLVAASGASSRTVSAPSVTALGSGLAVSWVDYTAGEFSSVIKARVYDASNNALTDAFAVAADLYVYFSIPSVVGISADHLLVAWGDLSFASYTQVFTAAGVAAGSAFSVFTDSSYLPKAQLLNTNTVLVTSVLLDTSAPAAQTVSLDLPVPTTSAPATAAPATSAPATPAPLPQLGVKIGSPVQVSDTTVGIAIAAIGSGKFILLNAESYTLVMGYRLDAAGVRIGKPFVAINATAEIGTPSIAALSTGSFVVAWTQASDTTSDIFARVFAASGHPLTAVFRVNDWTDSEQSGSAVAATNNGFVVSWASRVNGSYIRPYAKVYNNRGKVVTAEFPLFTINAGEMENQQVAGLSNGGFAAVWPSKNGIYLRTFSARGVAAGTEVLVAASAAATRTTQSPKVAAFGSGLVVTWVDDSLGYFEVSYRARIYDSLKVPATSSFTITTGLMDYIDLNSVAVIESEHLVTTWTQYLKDPAGSVLLKVVDGAGSDESSEFEVHREDGLYGVFPQSAYLGGQVVAVAWMQANAEDTVVPLVQSVAFPALTRRSHGHH